MYPSRHRTPFFTSAFAAKGARRASAPSAQPTTLAVALAAALLVVGGLQAAPAQAQSTKGAWFAAGGASNQARAARPAAIAAHAAQQRQQVQARDTLTLSIANLNRTANAIAEMQAAQAKARLAAQAQASAVPDGHTPGGLWDRDAQGNLLSWRGAERPVASGGQGDARVTVTQTEARAVLNWDTFNVGRDTTLTFEQQADWAVLNRVNDPQARPSQILGKIQGDGTVMVVNRNGVVFTGSSQVNVRNLAASAVGMTDAQFDQGLYGEAKGSGNVPTFANDLTVSTAGFTHGAATADVVVQAGARINTHQPASVTQGGGYVLLVGRHVENAGQIATPGGQTTLAAGDAFVIRKGVATDANQNSSTRGNVVTPLLSASAPDAAHLARNSGLIQASTGDITLVGKAVQQDGVAVSTTSVYARGTIHLEAVAPLAGSPAGSVTLGRDSVSAVVLDESATTALDVQREAMLKASASVGDGEYHRRDQSLIQLRSAGDIVFAGESLTLATGGQILVQAAARSDVQAGARLDVAGHVGVRVAMEANNVEINVQGNEQRDAPGNRDDKSLNNATIWLDRRNLVLVKAGTNGYDTDRWYTAGGLLEVGGYLGITGHGIGEWSAQGGTVRFGGGDVVTRQGASINLSGGTLDVQTGFVYQTFLRGADGRLYNASTAPGDMLYVGVYQGYEVDHARWGVTRRFYNPLLAPVRRLEHGYTVGRDAGQLIIATTTATLEGEIEAAVFQGDKQVRAREAQLDGYLQAQNAMARRGQLIIGSYTPVYDKDSRNLMYSPQAMTDHVTLGGAFDEAVGMHLDADWLNRQGLGELRVYAKQSVQVDDAIQVADGGVIALHATQVRVNADLGARGGEIALGDVVSQWLNGSGWAPAAIGTGAGKQALTQVAQGVRLDARGVWSNLRLDAQATQGLAHIAGGSIRIASSGTVEIAQGALLDTSAGAAMMLNESVRAARGGDIVLQADALAPVSGTAGPMAELRLDGELRSVGGLGGGRLVLQSGGSVVIGGEVAGSDGVLRAGQASLVDLVTTEAFVIGAGAILPLDYQYTRNLALPGEAIGSQPLVSWQDPSTKITLAADWTLPLPDSSATSYNVRLTTGRTIWVYSWQAAPVLPAGTVIDSISGSFPESYVVSAAVFPQGLAIKPTTGIYKAGTVTLSDVHIAAGTRLSAGTTLPQDIGVLAPLHVNASLLRQGFSSYEVAGHQSLAVAADAQIAVTMPVWQLNLDAARDLASGSDPAPVLQAWLPELFQEDAKRGKLGQRLGADLILRAGSDMLSQSGMIIGQGAQLAVDPGRTVRLVGNGQVTVEGAIRAAGGTIQIDNFGYPNNGPNAVGHDQSIWIGEHAVLDVSGIAAAARDRDGRRYGRVLNGGNIRIGGTYSANASEADAVDAFIVIRPGAQLNASGASVVLDLPQANQTTVASAGGLIYLSSYNGLYLDGEMRAQSGGAGAAGGTLALVLESPNYASNNNPSNQVRQVRELLLAREQGPSVLADTLAPGRADAQLVYGYGRLGADRIVAGGFDNLSLLVNGILALAPGLDVTLGQSLRLTAGSISLPQDAQAGAQVRLAAPYVRLGGAMRAQKDHFVMPYPQAGRFAEVLTDSQLLLEASLLDVAEAVSFGTNGTLQAAAGVTIPVQRAGFQTVTLRSQGDMRFVNSVARDRTSLDTVGNLVLAARQIYPTTGARVEVRAGRLGSVNEWGTYLADFDPNAVLRIERVGHDDPVMPYSVFGSLSLMSANIEQGGVLRAPLGGILLGHELSGTQQTSRLVLLPGSVTSVSAAGLVMPYGGTIDGLTYLYNGVDVLFKGVGEAVGSLFGVTLRNDDIQVLPGATIDLSGGGELTGAAFLAGRGGSTDARLNPLLQIQAGGGGFVLPGLATNPVYAIVPGVQQGYAPVGAEKGAGDPMVGQQVTIADGVPGLPAGTYTLLPSNYALLPGAFRVELNGLAGGQRPFGAQVNMRNGSYATSGRLSVADTPWVDVRTTQLIVTPADLLRSYSQYNETSYADFAMDWAVRDGAPRPRLERDAARMTLQLRKAQPGQTGNVQIASGSVQSAVEADGWGSQLVVSARSNDLEILAAGAAPTTGFGGVSVHADALNAVGAASVVVGGTLISEFASPLTFSTQNAAKLSFGSPYESARSVTLRSGATLNGAQVFLVAGRVDGGITVEEGAAINTIGHGSAGWDARSGYVLSPDKNAVLAVSNGWLEIGAPVASTGDGYGAGAIHIGTCAASSACVQETRLLAEGTITAATDSAFSLADAVRYGARNLVLAVGAINVGDAQTLVQAQAQGLLPPGLTLNQQVLNRLLRGDTTLGAPALENLVLTARDAINFHGSVTLSTLDPSSGVSSLERLVLTTPAIYGAGSADDVARIETSILVWNGATQPPGAVVQGGVGSGSGQLVVDARVIELGYGPRSQPDTVSEHDRRTLGFRTVNLNATERLTANQKGSLAVYQSQGAWDEATKSYAYHGGNLILRTPLLTGQAGSVTRIVAGGDMLAQAPAGASRTDVDNALLTGALGAELALQAGGGLTLDTAVLLPSGKLTLAAGADLVLEDGAQLDLAGRRLVFFDVEKYSWGGDVSLSSRHGDIRQSAASRIAIDAVLNRAGTLSATALSETAGRVDLRGILQGGSSGKYDAGGTWVPYAAAYADVRAQQIVDFTGLNARLNEGGLVGGRSFQLASGDLVIGDELKAREINISVDRGHLSVVGRVDASGEQVGSIRLHAGQGVSIAGSAVLDASASVLRRDSYGQIIEAPNRAVIEIGAGAGRLTLASGARLLLTVAGAPQAYGTVTLNAPRLGGAQGHDVDIDARGALQIDGARSVTVNAFYRYNDARSGDDTTVSGREYQVIDQAYLDAKHRDSEAFMAHALANRELMDGKLAGLRTQRDAFHLRPGVEIVSASADGDLHIDGDIDLSGHRYDSVNPNSMRHRLINGSGEAGALVLRAGGNLEIYGSLSDGFDGARLPVTADDQGWVLPAGRLPFGGDIIVPHGGLVTLAPGTRFEQGRTLNYDLPTPVLTLPSGVTLPVGQVLDQALNLTAGAVMHGPIYDASGQVLYAAGTVLSQDVTLPVGTRLGAGFRLLAPTRFQAGLWPAGVPLPLAVTLAQSVTLAKGAIVPAETDVVLPNGAEMVDLRPLGADETQGRIWALAPMLQPGSQSWDLRLVAGADRDAADSRLTAPGAQGVVRLADPHFGLVLERLPVPGTGTPNTYKWSDDISADDIMIFLGVEGVPGEPITQDTLDLMFSWGYFVNSVEEINEFGMGILVAVDVPGESPEYRLERKPARQTLFSVLRTGAGDLDVIAAGDFDMTSPFGVYTAGTSSLSVPAGQADPYNQARGLIRDGTVLWSKEGAAYEPLVDGGASSLYSAWYPEQGGNVLLRVGGDLKGDLVGANNKNVRAHLELGRARQQIASVDVGTWLWRQGSGSLETGGEAMPTAWWINFGTYVAGPADMMRDEYGQWLYANYPFLTGFTGVGTLGGGNLVVQAGGHAGMIDVRGDAAGNGQSQASAGTMMAPRSQGLHLAVGSTGRVQADGTLRLTGGGDLDIRIGGTLNPNAELRGNDINLNSTFVNLRGALNLAAGSVGGIKLRYGVLDHLDTRGGDQFNAGRAFAGGGPALVLGDASARLDTRGDLVLGGVGDPGRTRLYNATPFQYLGSHYAGEGWSWFSLWTPATAVDLFSAGGNLTPTTAWADGGAAEDVFRGSTGRNTSSTSDGAHFYPSVLRASAANGSIYYGVGTTAQANNYGSTPLRTQYGLSLAPSPVGEQFVNQTGKGVLELLAQQSIYASGYSITASTADPAGLSSPLRPGFLGLLAYTGGGQWGGEPKRIHTLSAEIESRNDWVSRANGRENSGTLFVQGTTATTGYATPGQTPARYYAVDGDIVALRVGSMVGLGYPAGTKGYRYEGSIPVAVRAGRDITNSGTRLGGRETVENTKGNLISHSYATDVSVVEAGRDIRESSFYVTGPGLLDVAAGRHLFFADRGELTSLGDILREGVDSRTGGASIAVSAGLGAGAEWAAFAERYLNPENQANLDLPFADQPGKALVIYSGELTLTQWLRREFGFQGDDSQADAFLAAQQAVLDRQSQAQQAAGLPASTRSLARDYQAESQLHLVNWLTSRFGPATVSGAGLASNGTQRVFDAKDMDARAFLATLPIEHQRAYLRAVYYAELKAGGREYNDAAGKRFGSYLRGREAIATLLPAQDAQGQARSYEGDLTLFSSAVYYDDWTNSNGIGKNRPIAGRTYITREEWVAMGSPGYGVSFYDVSDAGLHTNFGGDIDILVPGGRTLVGVDGGFTPGAGSGVITQGAGDINIYSRGSILMGQSRIFTTFGGSILAWSAQGDINAGRGSKTTVVYTPQRRAYDMFGNIALSPSAPSSGAGIATLNPIPEIPAGDIDLVAPEGVIDAGEAGIRVSGNVNLAAMRVVNAENIQVQGESTGMPVVATVNVGALTSASSAASSAASAAQESVQRARSEARQSQSSIINVQILGFGEEGGGGRAAAAPGASAMQVVGEGQLAPAQLALLTPEERQRLGM